MGDFSISSRWRHLLPFDRHAPNPRGPFSRCLLALVPCISLTVELDVLSRSYHGFVWWERVGVTAAVATGLVFLARSQRRREVARAEAVYGPDWRVMTRDERRAAWQHHQLTSVLALVQPPYAVPVRPLLQPSDPSNPFSTPLLDSSGV